MRRLKQRALSQCSSQKPDRLLQSQASTMPRSSTLPVNSPKQRHARSARKILEESCRLEEVKPAKSIFTNDGNGASAAGLLSAETMVYIPLMPVLGTHFKSAQPAKLPVLKDAEQNIERRGEPPTELVARA
eukprot:6209152-Pleurochrysis_carterae.AAC.5